MRMKFDIEIEADVDDSPHHLKSMMISQIEAVHLPAAMKEIAREARDRIQDPAWWERHDQIQDN